MTPDLSALRKLALAATPGPWHLRTNRHPTTDGRPWGWLDGIQGGPLQRAIPGVNVTWEEGAKSYSNAQFIAAANPAVVLALLDQVASSAARLAAAERVVEAGRAVYENDDVWTAHGKGHERRDQAMGKALAAYDAALDGGEKGEG